MRTHLLLLATVSALTASAAATTHTADACGVYMLSPRVFWLAHNTGKTAFVVEGLDDTPVDADKFTPLAPDSYDAAAILPQPDRSAPFALTLVGKHGTAAVSTAKEVLLRGAWATHGKQVRALAIDAPGDERDTLAVAGKHVGLQLLPIAWPAEDRAQITATLTADVKYDDAIHDYRVTLHDPAGKTVGLMVGRPRAVLAADGQLHLVVDTDGVARAYLIGS